MKRPRDYQRAKLYAAERKAFPNFEKPEWTDIDAVRTFAFDTFRDPRIRAKFGKHVRKFPLVTDGGRKKAAAGNEHEINMPAWSRSRWVTLHELAHTISLRRAIPGTSWHGANFAGVYIFLVETRMGLSHADALRLAFIEGGVQFNEV